MLITQKRLETLGKKNPKKQYSAPQTSPLFRAAKPVEWSISMGVSIVESPCNKFFSTLMPDSFLCISSFILSFLLLYKSVLGALACPTLSCMASIMLPLHFLGLAHQVAFLTCHSPLQIQCSPDFLFEYHLNRT